MVVLRHSAIQLPWRTGSGINTNLVKRSINDPNTSAPAVKNPSVRTQNSGRHGIDGMKKLQERGAMFVYVTWLTVNSMFTAKLNLNPDEVKGLVVAYPGYQ
jgi:hypothetical protein